ncbi:MAG: hypothetical protein WCI57_01815 [Candidatus Berkelbacteria bacterium]
MSQALNQTIKDVMESDIFVYLKLEEMPEDDKAKMIENVLSSLKSRVMLRVADYLEEQGKFEEFKSILNEDTPSDEKINTYLTDNKVPVDVFTAEESIILKAEIMGLKPQIAGGKDAR